MAIHKYKKAVITGASSGIGLATAKALHANGIEILAIARREERLLDLASVIKCQTLAADIRDIDRIKDTVVDFSPDIIINNAGVGHGVTGLSSLDGSTIEEAISINVIAPIKLTAVVVEGMKVRRRGHIVNIGSISGIHTMTSALYGASKSAIHRFSQNLRMELRGTSVRVTELCPGRVSSEFYDAAKGDQQMMAAAKNTGINELNAEDVAQSIIFALQAPLHVNIATIEILPTEQTVGGVDITPAKF